MNHYMVYAINEEGNKTLEFLKAENIASAFELLEKSGSIPIKVRELPQYLSFLSTAFEPKLKNSEVIEILDNLHVGIKNGVNLNDAIVDILEDSENPNIKKILTKILLKINRGDSLSSAFSEYEAFFTQIVVNLVKIGEETGKLAQVLDNSASFLKKIADLKSKIKKAMIYPVVALLLMFVAISAWMILVVPQLVSFFKDMDVELPPLTQFLIAASDFINEYILTILGGVTIFVILIRIIYTKVIVFKLLISKLLLKLPTFSTLIKSFNIAFITEYLKLGLTSGLTLYESLILVDESLNNMIYKAQIADSIEGLKAGYSFSETLRKNPHLFTKFSVRMISMGEINGVLDRQLKILSENYYTKVDEISTAIPKIIQPMVILVGGGVMALIMLGLMGPIYDLISKM